MQRHSYSHSGLRPFQCNICAKSFSQSANLKTHIKNTHPEAFNPTDEPQSLSSSQQPSFSSKAFVAAATAVAAAAAAENAAAVAGHHADQDPANNSITITDRQGEAALSALSAAKTEPRDNALASDY